MNNAQIQIANKINCATILFLNVFLFVDKIIATITNRINVYLIVARMIIPKIKQKKSFFEMWV